MNEDSELAIMGEVQNFLDQVIYSEAVQRRADAELLRTMCSDS